MQNTGSQHLPFKRTCSNKVILKEVIMQRWEYCSLRQTEQGLVYTIYRANRYIITLVYQGQDIDDALTSYITRLSFLGWNIIQPTLSNGGDGNWHFKRSIHSRNQYLNFSDQDTKGEESLDRPCRSNFKSIAFSCERKPVILLSLNSNDLKIKS
jgi:hypothetical protein